MTEVDAINELGERMHELTRVMTAINSLAFAVEDLLRTEPGEVESAAVMETYVVLEHAQPFITELPYLTEKILDLTNSCLLHVERVVQERRKSSQVFQEPVDVYNLDRTSPCGDLSILENSPKKGH